MTGTDTVHYAPLPEGGFLAAAPHRPDVYLTWLSPGTICSLNVSAWHREGDKWVPIAIGRHLSWDAFTTQAERHLRATPTHHHAVCGLVFSRDLSVARCQCGHWRTRVDNHDSHTLPADLAGARRAFDAHVALEAAYELAFA